MTIKTYKPCTPSLRSKSTLNFSNLIRKKPEKSLLVTNHRAQGRNNSGKITVRHKGGGHKRLYRIIDFKRNKLNILGKVFAIEYDPNRNANIALIVYSDGEKRYILHSENLAIGDLVLASSKATLSAGNCLPLAYIAPGTLVHNIELYPGRGGQIARAAGTFAKILAQEEKHTILRLMSKEIRLISNRCKATIGKVSNFDACNIIIGKAGRNR